MNIAVRIVCLLFTLMLASPLQLMAHAGKVHIMGTVAAMGAQSIEVKATDGSIKSILLNSHARYQRGTEKIELRDLKIGERIVVHATPGKGGTLTADEIHMGTAAAKRTVAGKAGGPTAAKKPNPSAHSH